MAKGKGKGSSSKSSGSKGKGSTTARTGGSGRYQEYLIDRPVGTPVSYNPQNIPGTNWNAVNAATNAALAGVKLPATTETKPDWLLQWEAAQAAQAESTRVSAKAVAKTLAKNLGLKESIVDKISDLIINQGYTEESVQVAIRDLPEFKERFAGIDKYNKTFAADIAAGRKAQAVDPYTYIQLEKDYQEILTRSGLGDMANQATYAELIGGDVSVDETKARIVNVYDKVKNADSLLKDTLKTYFPTLDDTDFAKALLTGKNPEDMAAQLQRKVQRAEIGSESRRFNIQTAEQSINELEALGITREQARVGFSNVSRNLSATEKLARLYEGTSAGIQEELTSEQFKGLQSERRKKLQKKEEAMFSGSAGTNVGIAFKQQVAGAI